MTMLWVVVLWGTNVKLMGRDLWHGHTLGARGQIGMDNPKKRGFIVAYG